MTPASLYVEAPLRLASGLDVVVTGQVDGDEVRCFAAEDLLGRPVRIDDQQMPVALAELVAAARELWGSP